MIPVVVCFLILAPGLVYSIIQEILNNKDAGMPKEKIIYLSVAFASYLLYWIIIYTCWKTCVQKGLNKKAISFEKRTNTAHVLRPVSHI